MCRSARNDGCAAQTNPTPDPTLTLTLTLEVGRGSIGFTCKSEDLARTCN